MKDENSKGTTTQKKLRKLRKQYNQMLVSLFDQHAGDCIERALDESPGAFGENINIILDNALNYLRQCVCKELDMNTEEDSCDDTSMGVDGIAIGPGVAIGVKEVGSAETTEDSEMDEESDDESEDDEI